MPKVFILLLGGQTFILAVIRLQGADVEQSTFWGIWWIITVIICVVLTIRDKKIKWWC